MTKDSVYADPIRKIQEDLYVQLLAIREGFANTLTEACQSASTPSTSNEDVDKLKKENTKL